MIASSSRKTAEGCRGLLIDKTPADLWSKIFPEDISSSTDLDQCASIVFVTLKTTDCILYINVY